MSDEIFRPKQLQGGDQCPTAQLGRVGVIHRTHLGADVLAGRDSDGLARGCGTVADCGAAGAHSRAWRRPPDGSRRLIDSAARRGALDSAVVLRDCSLRPKATLLERKACRILMRYAAHRWRTGTDPHAWSG
jgi:hypothetical protein